MSGAIVRCNVSHHTQINKHSHEGGGGGRAMMIWLIVVIHTSPSKKIHFKHPTFRTSRNTRIIYGRQNPVVGLGTKKPHVASVWLELFPMWKYQDSSLFTRAVAMSKYFSTFSTPMKLRLSCFAILPVVPEPRNGSNTVSPLLLHEMMWSCASCSGN